MRPLILFTALFTCQMFHGQDVENLCTEPVTGRFWGIKGVSGDIWEYTISGGTVQTGEIVLDGPAPMWSFAYCNVAGPTSFYSGNGTGGYRYYENNSWVNVNLGVDMFKCGGQGSHLYFTEQGHTERLYHCIGSTATLIADVGPGRFRSDIVVNSDGNALVPFSVDEFTYEVDEYRMYSPTGELLQAYPVEYGWQGQYGSFLLGDVLYLGFAQTVVGYSNVLVPLTFTGGVATLGTPIPFVHAGETDLASCGTSTVGLAEVASMRNVLVIHPNPASEELLVQLPSTLIGGPLNLLVMDARGTVVSVHYAVQGDQLKLDVYGLPVGIYQMMILDASTGVHSARFVRQ